jgi:hypothetical protein
MGYPMLSESYYLSLCEVGEHLGQFHVEIVTVSAQHPQLHPPNGEYQTSNRF